MATNWHGEHERSLTTGERLADAVAAGLGSWPFIVGQTVFVLIWMALNVVGWMRHWDPYPFILLNLIFSVQAAYAAPVIMMSQNRQADRDRYQAQVDFETDKKSECEVEEIQVSLARIEAEKLDRILQLLEAQATAETRPTAGDQGSIRA